MDATAAVRAAVLARAAELGVDADAVRVAYVPNAGGFANQSFHVTDGARRLHVKLAADAEAVAGLRRWRRMHRTLERDHLAPPMLDWLAVAGTPLEGPVFAHVDGAPPVRPTRPLVAALRPAVRRLHEDRALAALIGGTAVRAADVHRRTYHERALADLAIVARAGVPFADAALVGWMRAEAAAVRRLVRATPAFEAVVAAPTHGDLWANNLLHAPDGRWWILDWDDLALGDPALDWAMLLGPSRADVSLDALDALGDETGLAGPARARLDVYARASLLDWVIDPLADWVEAAGAPVALDATRRELRAVHEAALAAYRRRFGDARG